MKNKQIRGTQSPCTPGSSESSVDAAPFRLGRISRLATLLLALSSPAIAQTVTFTGVQTVVPATGLVSPTGVTVDKAHNVYIADQGYGSILKIAPDGTQSGVGSGFSYPTNTALDSSGNLYVADSQNYRVVKVAPDGTQSTVGSGLGNVTGVAVDAAGNVYVADSAGSRVLKVTAAGIQSTLGTGISHPFGIAVDGTGNVYVAEPGASLVYKITTGGVQSTIGTGLSAPYGVSVDSTGRIYIADSGSSHVIEIDGGMQTSVGAALSGSTSITSDSTGDVYVADIGQATVYKLQLQAVDFGIVNACPAGTNNPAPCSQTATFNFVVNTSGTFGSTNALTQGAANLDFNITSDGCAGVQTAGSNCSVTSTFVPQTPGARYGVLQPTDSTGAALTTVYIRGTGKGPHGVFYAGTQQVPFTGYNFPFGVVKDASGNFYIADHNNNRVLKETLSGGAYVETTIGSGLSLPVGLAVDGAGNVYVGDQHNNRVLKETFVAGTYTQSVVDGNLSNPNGVAVDGSGNVYVADTSNSRVLKETLSGSSYTQSTVGTGLVGPGGVAVDGAGNIYISDSGNNRVLEETLSGSTYIQSTVSTNFSNPFGISVDGSGNAYVSDYNNNRVLKEVLLGGTYVESTIATGLSGPGAVTVDQNGNVFIADSNNGRIVEVDVTDPPTLKYESTNVGSVSASQTETLVNIGNADLGFVTPNAGSNPSISANFTLSSSGSTACPLVTTTSFTSGTLPAGASCDLSISFAPTVAGRITGSLVLTDTNLNAGSPNYTTQTISLRGTGIALIPSQLATSSVPATVVSGGNLGTVTATVENANGNTVTNSTAPVTATITGPNGYSQTVTANAVNGVASLNLSSLPLTTVGSYTVTTSSPGLTGTSSTVTVTAGVATQLSLSGLPNSTVAGGNLGIVTAIVEDASGNTVTGSTAAITATFTGPNGFSQTLSGSAVNGVLSLDLSSFQLPKVGSYYVSLSSAGLSPYSVRARVVAGPAAQLVLSTLPPTLSSGGNLGSVTVSVNDAFGNPVSSPTGIMLTLTGPGGYSQTLSGSTGDGPATFNLSSFALTTTGTYTVTDSSTGLSGTSSPVTVVAGPASQLATTAVPTTLVSGSNLGTLTATIKDAAGNTATTSTAPVTTTITGSNSYSQSVTANAVNGVASLNLSSLPLTTAGVYTVATSSPGLTGTSSMVTVTAGTASKLATSLVPSSLISGSNLASLAATIEDANGNTITSSTAPVTTTITGPNGYSQTVTANAVSGVASLNLSSLPLTTAGVYTVATSSPGLTGTSSMVTVTAGAASALVLGPIPASIVSGGNLGTTTATIKDANGNTATNYTGPITATLNGPNGYAQAVTGTAVNGVASLNLSSLAPTPAGFYTLTATGAGLTPASATTTVTPAPQSIPLSLPDVTYGAGATTLPSTTSAGLPITYAVTGPATLNGSSLMVTGAGTVTLTATQAGDASHSSVTLTQTFTVAKAVSNTTLSSSSGVATTGTAVTLTTQVASTAGTPTGTVTFLNGSTVLGTATVSSTGSATLTLSTLPTGALSLTAAYGGDANFRASTSALAVTTVQDFGIAATAGTPSVPVVPGAAASFTLALPPGATGFSSAITLTATGLPAGATYSFSPATVTPGSTTASTVLTVQTTKPVVTARRLEGAAGIAFALLFVPFGISRKGREALRKSRPMTAFGVLLLLGGLAGLTGCGTSNGFFGQPGASYTITVTGTSGTLVHSTTVVLNVQ